MKPKYMNSQKEHGNNRNSFMKCQYHRKLVQYHTKYSCYKCNYKHYHQIPASSVHPSAINRHMKYAEHKKKK